MDPDAVSLKSLRLLEPKLRWLAEYAEFGVNINSVVGSGIPNPEDAVEVARRARELGFTNTIGILHDGRGQLRPLEGPRDEGLRGAEEVRQHGRRPRERALPGQPRARKPNDWSCRAGARYLYVDENGLVHYCSQMRGVPGIPLESYGAADIEREYYTKKSCAPYCTINCVQRVAVFDNWRAPQKAFTLRPRRPLPPSATARRAARGDGLTTPAEPRALVTGASSGIGEAFARALPPAAVPS